MLISVITITFNAEATLPATLRSVEAQTFTDFEYLIIDGRSTDRTVELARGCPLAKVTSEPDRGLYDAMNKGLRLAQGRYVLFLNAGDTLPAADTLSRYADAIASAAPQEPGMVYGQTAIVDADGRYLRERHFRAPRRLDCMSFSRGMTVCHQAMLVRRDLAPEYDLRYRFSADYDWACKVLRRSPLNIYIDGYTANYLSEGVTTANRRASLRERFAIMRRHYGLTRTLISHLKAALRKFTSHS